MPNSLHDHEFNAPTKRLQEHVRDVIEYDDARASAPHEHAVTLLAAVGFALCALRTPTRTAAVVHAMVAGALLFRAASGRDGMRRWAGAKPARPADVATPGQGPHATDWRTSGPEASDPLPGSGYAGA